MDEATRVCTKCLAEQPLNNFPLRDKSTTRRYWQCRQCKNSISSIWNKTHPERVRVTLERYEKAHPKRRTVFTPAQQKTRQEAVARYIKTHPEKVAADRKRRRARKVNAPVNDFTAAQWKAMQEHYDHRCAYCGKRAKGHLTQDHITPLSKGGSHTVQNIVPSCRSCNASKGTKPAPIMIQPLLLTIAKPNRKKKNTEEQL